MSSYIKVEPGILKVIRAVIVALAVFSLFMLFSNPGQNSLLWAVLLLPVILLKFLHADTQAASVPATLPQQRQAEHQGREAVAYIVSILAIVIPVYWLFSVATSSDGAGPVGFPMLLVLMLVPLIVTGLVGLRNLVMRSRDRNNSQKRLSGQVFNGIIVGVICAAILLFIISNLSF